MKTIQSDITQFNTKHWRQHNAEQQVDEKSVNHKQQLTCCLSYYGSSVGNFRFIIIYIIIVVVDIIIVVIVVDIIVSVAMVIAVPTLIFLKEIISGFISS